jgi:aspartate/methionine/tyrosine aminotransferase
VDEMAKAETFKGYGPEQGYAFLREAIADNAYKSRGVDISPMIFSFPTAQSVTPATSRRFLETTTK